MLSVAVRCEVRKRFGAFFSVKTAFCSGSKCKHRIHNVVSSRDSEMNRRPFSVMFNHKVNTARVFGNITGAEFAIISLRRAENRTITQLFSFGIFEHIVGIQNDSAAGTLSFKYIEFFVFYVFNASERLKMR